MKLSLIQLAIALILLALPHLGAAQTVRLAPGVKPVAWGSLLQFDFNGANPWPNASVTVVTATPANVISALKKSAVGTIDTTNGTESSGGLSLMAQAGITPQTWAAVFSSGLLPLANTGADLGKLTLAFSLSASSARPVIVRVESFNAKKVRTGGLETTIYPAAPDFYQRFALDGYLF